MKSQSMIFEDKFKKNFLKRQKRKAIKKSSHYFYQVSIFRIQFIKLLVASVLEKNGDELNSHFAD